MDHVVRIGSRGSKLAIWQANFVANRLQEAGFRTEIFKISTLGDRVQDRFLHEIGGKGVFIREIEKQLLQQKIDLAVHSLKDMPAVLPEGLQLAACLKRHSPTDVVVLPERDGRIIKQPGRVWGAEEIKQIGSLTLATGSLRRQFLLSSVSGDIETVPIRGNVDTRLAKLEQNLNWDGILLAEAAMERLQIVDSSRLIRLAPEWFVPSATQGVLAVEMCQSSSFLSQVRKVLNCENSERMAEFERQVLRCLGADCELPVGVYATRQKDGRCSLSAVVLTETGSLSTGSLTFDSNTTPQQAASDLMSLLVESGLEEVMKELGMDFLWRKS